MVGASSATVPRANDDTPLVYRAIQQDQEAFGELRSLGHRRTPVTNSAPCEANRHLSPYEISR